MLGRAFRSASGRFEQRLATTRVRYAFGRRLALFAQYGYGYHLFQDVQLSTPTLPVRFGRHAVRAGVTAWLPLYGSY